MQQNSNDCSIACLMTVLMYYKIKPDRSKLLKSINNKSSNYTAYDIVKMSRVYDLKCQGIKTSIEKVSKFPLIAHIMINDNYFHFIVVYKTNRKRKIVTLMDPALGLKEMSFNDFNKVSTGIFLIFDKTGNIKKDNRLKKEFIKIVSSNKKIVMKTLVLSMIFIVLSLMFNYYLNLVLQNHKNLSFIKLIVIIFLLIVLLKNFINYIKNNLILNLNIQIDKDITDRLIKHILSLPYRYFNSKTSGELITIISDVESLKKCVINIFILSFIDIFLLSIIILYIYFLNVYIGMFLTLFTIIIFILTNKFKYIFYSSFTPYKVRNIDYNSNLIEVLSSIDTIKNLNLENKVYKGLNRKYISMKNSERNYNKKYYNYNFFNSYFTDNSYILLIILSLLISTFYSYSIYNIVLYSSLFYMIISFLQNITSTITTYKVEEEKVNRALEILYEDKEKDVERFYLLINKITYSNICYKNILKNINLEINKNDRVFIMGPSGVGKSTLIKLLLNYFTPSSGSILIDDIDIKEYGSYFLRDKITYISQNEAVFKGSIISNLKIATDDMEKIKTISKATLLDKILLKNRINYNYIIEQFGANLSGGEKKKLILTRGLLRMKEVLILDEVFNEISIYEETIILKNIFKLFPDKIIIVISHRNNNINLFNKKYFLKGDDMIEIK